MMAITNLYRIEWADDATECNAESPMQALVWFATEFAPENGIENFADISVERIGFTVEDGDTACDYRGSINLNERICKIEWRMEDLICVMVNHGIEITDENIERVLSNRFERTLQERSTEEGWEIIDTLVSTAF